MSKGHQDSALAGLPMKHEDAVKINVGPETCETCEKCGNTMSPCQVATRNRRERASLVRSLILLCIVYGIWYGLCKFEERSASVATANKDVNLASSPALTSPPLASPPLTSPAPTSQETQMQQQYTELFQGAAKLGPCELELVMAAVQSKEGMDVFLVEDHRRADQRMQQDHQSKMSHMSEELSKLSVTLRKEWGPQEHAAYNMITAGLASPAPDSLPASLSALLAAEKIYRDATAAAEAAYQQAKTDHMQGLFSSLKVYPRNKNILKRCQQRKAAAPQLALPQQAAKS